MTHAAASPRTALSFGLWLAVGLFVGLGIRSSFVEASDPPPVDRPPPAHHDSAGHAGHEHGDDAPASASRPSAPHSGHDAAQQPDPGPSPGADASSTGVLLLLGNDACPIMGGQTDGETFTDWNGLRVGHCCAGCSEDFLADPAALLDRHAPGWRDVAAAADAIDAADGEEREALLKDAAARWTVVRRPAASDPAAGER